MINVAAQIVIWGFLVAIVVVVISGYLLPWWRGRPLEIFGSISIPSPLGASTGFRNALEVAHEISGDLFAPLLILHLLGTAKHAVINRDGVASRMFKSVTGGR